MISEFLYVGKYILVGTAAIMENRNLILSACSAYDITKFSFMAADKLGLIEFIQKKISPTEKIIIIQCSEVKTDIGDFELIDINL